MSYPHKSRAELEAELNEQTDDLAADIRWLEFLLKTQPDRAAALAPQIERKQAELIEQIAARHGVTAEYPANVAGADVDPLASYDHLLANAPVATQTDAAYMQADLTQDPTVQRLNRRVGYDIFTALATKSPERVKWEQEYLEKRRRNTR